MKNIQYLIPRHVKRKGNVAADYLANWGCQNVERTIDGRPTDAIWNVELHSLQVIVHNDQHHPDPGAQVAEQWQSRSSLERDRPPDHQRN